MSAGRRRTTLEKLADELAKTPMPASSSTTPAQVNRSKRAREKADAQRTAPEWSFKSSTATTPAVARLTREHPDGRCHHVLGCDDPALPDRWSCAKHTAELEVRAERIRTTQQKGKK